jgi:hypothetical protein
MLCTLVFPRTGAAKTRGLRVPKLSGSGVMVWLVWLGATVFSGYMTYKSAPETVKPFLARIGQGAALQATADVGSALHGVRTAPQLRTNG